MAAALEVAPGNPRLEHDIAVSLFLGVAADPKLRAAHASLGLALARLGQGAEAAPHLEKALELDDDGSRHYQLARAYQAAGAVEKSRAAMTRYQEIVKRNQEQKEAVAREAQDRAAAVIGQVGDLPHGLLRVTNTSPVQVFRDEVQASKRLRRPEIGSRRPENRLQPMIYINATFRYDYCIVFRLGCWLVSR